jgi:23S rRNA pseudouridine2605 synthase
MMLEGRVSVNGVTVRELGTKADPSHDDIRVDGSRVKIVEQHRYILLNKPRGYVTTRADPERRKTVLDLLRGVKEYVYPVGRLDYESEGLLLLMNDGDLAARLTHPSHGIARVYEATVLGIPDAHDLERLQRGLTIDGRRMRASEVSMQPLKRDAKGATLVITLREGRNRQVRNMCDAIGHPVDHLKRVAIGPLRDSRLKLGYWRDLNEEEVARLRKSVALVQPAAATKAKHPGGRGGQRGKDL